MSLFKKTILALYCTLVALIGHSQHEIWGATFFGGEHNAGVIIATDGLGNNAEVKHHFDATEGQSPKAEIAVYDGKYYGMTADGGLNHNGVLFEYDPATEKQEIIFRFDASLHGDSPLGRVLVLDDQVYGMTSSGGPNGYGVLFAYDLNTQSYIHLVDFSTETGANPEGGVLAYQGALYGMTKLGGAEGDGVIFKYDLASSSYNILHSFEGTGGRGPVGDLTLHNDKLFGATYFGGDSDSGVLFEFDLETNTYTKKYDFTGATNGHNPKSEITIYDNVLYGSTTNGGNNNYGVFYQFDLTTDEFTTLETFDYFSTGANSAGNHAVYNGKLYGINRSGGLNNDGVLYEFDPSTMMFSVLADLDRSYRNTEGGLIEDNGSLISMASTGFHFNGSMNRYDLATNTSTRIMDFSHANLGGNMGQSLTYFNGKLYGVTEDGVDGAGVLFEFDPVTLEYTKKVDFGGSSTTGIDPACTLVELNGKLYGTTNEGGSENGGVIFEYDPITDQYVDKKEISLASGLSMPTGHLTVYQEKIYGLNYWNGENDLGTIFEYDPTTNDLIKKIDFDGATIGAHPFGQLLEWNGLLYGTTVFGGVNDKGTLFSYDPATNVVSKWIDFDVTVNGFQPTGSLVELAGKFYGTTRYGGADDYGLIFEFDPISNLLSVEMELNGAAEGIEPVSGLIESQGLLLGLTRSGGEYDLGVMYAYDPVNNIYENKIDFAGENGSTPMITQLIKTPQICSNSTSLLEVNTCSYFDSPSGDTTYFASGSYTDILYNQNSCGADSIIHINLTILNTSMGVDVQSACEPFTWIDGNTYDSSNNTATHVLMNAAGCDSTVTLNLTLTEIDVTTSLSGATITANATGASYQWVNCDNGNQVIEGETGQSFSATSNGNYAVVILENECEQTSDCVEISTIGLEEYDLKLVRIYPNPNSGLFYIDTQDKVEFVRVYDMAGSEMSIEFEPRNKEVRCGDITPGAYLMEIHFENSIVQSKLIIR